MNELQLELKNQLERFGKEKIEPLVEEDDRNEEFRMEIPTNIFASFLDDSR